MDGYVSYLKSLNEIAEGLKIALIYEGRVDQFITIALSELAETSVDRIFGKNPAQKKINFVLIELLQNIAKHSAGSYIDNGRYIGKGVLLMGKSGQDCYLISGNRILNKNVPQLQESGKLLSALSNSEISLEYAKQLSSGSFNEKGGVGLGLLDMAKKSLNNLRLNFLKLDDQFSFFTLCIGLKVKS